MQSVGAVAARPIGDFLNKIGEGIFVGTFRGALSCLPNTAAETNKHTLQPSHNFLALVCCAASCFPAQKLCGPACKIPYTL
jgi:hypothetical protein